MNAWGSASNTISHILLNTSLAVKILRHQSLQKQSELGEHTIRPV
jgi:hypothetical protein